MTQKKIKDKISKNVKTVLEKMHFAKHKLALLFYNKVNNKKNQIQKKLKLEISTNTNKKKTLCINKV